MLTRRRPPRRTEAARRRQENAAVAWQRDVAGAGGRVLLGARPPVAAQFHVQVQGDRRRGTEASPAARVPQRVAARRRSTSVSLKKNHLVSSDHLN